ncbi:hypothetical protein PVAP13_3NG073570 [Panicum virgatum]|uniref:Uncharacterized protein n=1 Tax=Panicum virgatum TaxID=38727 RepID=A0A8T0TYN5_PANVG|nr:hypothetical protein PVAP13_3NG073570 [Panicum virgatum]
MVKEVETPPGIRFGGTTNRKIADGAEAPNGGHQSIHDKSPQLVSAFHENQHLGMKPGWDFSWCSPQTMAAHPWPERRSGRRPHSRAATAPHHAQIQAPAAWPGTGSTTPPRLATRGEDGIPARPVRPPATGSALGDRILTTRARRRRRPTAHPASSRQIPASRD